MLIRASIGAANIGAALACLSVMLAVLLANGVRAEGIDTEHLFAFMIGSDTGNVGEREFQSQTTGRFGREGGRYRAAGEELEMEFIPAKDVRIELGGTFAAHDINGVAGFDDRRQFAWQGISVDFRTRFLDRDTAPFGFTVAVGHQADKIDETTGAAAWHYGTDLTLAFDREYVRLDGGEFGPLGTKAFLSFTHTAAKNGRGGGNNHRKNRGSAVPGLLFNE